MLLGAALGEELGGLRSRQPHSSSSPRLNPLSLYHWRPGLMQPWSPVDSVAGKLAIHCAEDLLQRRQAQEISQFANPVATPAEKAIAALPIMLYFHEDMGKLRQALRQNEVIGLYPETLAIGCAISCSLRERLYPANLLTQVIQSLEQSAMELAAPADTLIAQLSQVDALLKQRASLQQVTTELLRPHSVKAGHTTIPLAFYCFLSTPNEFHLSLLRAATISCPSLCALSAALSAACNSSAAIPLAWKLACSAPTYLLPWGIPSPALTHLATRLFALWAGAYDPATLPPAPNAIAAPGVIRPR